MTDRTAGLRGRKPPRPEGERFAIKWAHEYLAPTPPTYPVDVSQGIAAWGMLGNDTLGDCVPAGVGHDRMLAGAKPTTDEVVALYLAYDGGQDAGVVIANFLLWCYHQGLIEGFAPVELGMIDAVMAQFSRGVLLGVNLTGDANQLFNEGKPWTVANGETPDAAEGHCVLKTGAAAADGNGTVVTWGALQTTEFAWEQACIEEAWAIVTKDDMGEAAYAALIADLQGLPGATLLPGPVTPSPTPAPTPPPPGPPPAPTPPAPAPAPTPDIHGFIEEVKQIARDAIGKLEAVEQKILNVIEGK
jgi:hypothetical protein